MSIVFNFTGNVTINVSGATTIALPAGESPFTPAANVAGVAKPFEDTTEHSDANRILLDMLNDPNYRFRKIGTLAEAIGCDESDTEGLLEALGARQEGGNDELWGLVSRVGPAKSHGSY